MSCFLRESKVVDGMNPVKVYIMNNRKHVAKYDSGVKISHSVFGTLQPKLQESILKRKADKQSDRRFKEEKEMKESQKEPPIPKASVVKHSEIKEYSEKEKREAVKSFGHWVWRRFDADEVNTSYFKLKDGSGYDGFVVKNANRDWDAYWKEWKPILHLRLITPNVKIIFSKDDIIVSKLKNTDGKLPKTQEEVDRTFVVECRGWMNDPSPPVLTKI
jgi:hypothetical protein